MGRECMTAVFRQVTFMAVAFHLGCVTEVGRGACWSRPVEAELTEAYTIAVVPPASLRWLTTYYRKHSEAERWMRLAKQQQSAITTWKKEKQ